MTKNTKKEKKKQGKWESHNLDLSIFNNLHFKASLYAYLILNDGVISDDSLGPLYSFI